jgi:arylsulfatase A-like enzyme
MQNIGRLIEALDRLGVAENTMICFTSDHGDMQGSQGEKNKCLPYEESAGIPFIMVVPGYPGGRVTDGLVSGVDMMPTCLDLAGIDPVDSVDGQSIASFIRGETDQTCETVFSEREQWCMLVKDGWKLSADRTPDGLKAKLMFNLDEDPYEMTNRIEDADCADIRANMLEELTAWNNDVRPNGVGRRN